MNILQLTTHMHPGGIPVYVKDLSLALQRNGHQPLIVSSGGTLVSELKKGGVEAIDLDLKTRSELNPKLVKSFFSLCQIVKKHKIDVIHAHTRIAQVLGYFLTKNTSVPYMTTCHGFFTAKWSRRTFPFWGRRVIAISEAVRDHLKDNLKVSEDKIRLIPSGVDAKRFDPCSFESRENVRKKYDLEGKIVIGTIARLSDVKGHKYLIGAMKEVCRKIQNARLIVIGEGKEEESLKGLAGECALDGEIVFIPSVIDTREYLKAMDIFVLPSLQEGLGLSVLEAIAMSVPVIASDVGGLAEILDRGRFGKLVKPASAEALAEALCEMVRCLPQAKKEAGIVRGEILEKYSLDKMCTSIETLYEELKAKG